MRLRTRFIFSTVAVCGALAAATGAKPVQAQTFISANMNNGGFETPVVGAAGFVQFPANASFSFAGNSGISNTTAYGVVGGAAEGSQYGYLQVNTVGGVSTISQSFTLASASNVALNFALAGRSSGTAFGGNTTFTASFDSGTAAAVTAFAGATTTNTQFATQNATTTLLAAGTHTVTFSATGLTATDNTALLDNVNLTATAVDTPEPGSFALVGMGLVSGLGTLGIARKRRKDAAK